MKVLNLSPVTLTILIFLYIWFENRSLLGRGEVPSALFA